MKSKKVLFVLVFSILLLISICLGTNAEITDEHVLKIALPGEIPTLNPDFSRYPISNMVLLNIYEQWFQYAAKDVPGEDYTRSDINKIEGAAIETWEISDDRLSVTLNVRQGVLFPNTGNEMTANDIMYWLDKGPETKSGNLWNEDMASMESWEKTGPYQVKIHFKYPVQPMFWMLGRDQCWGVVDYEAVKDHFTKDNPWGSKWLNRNYAGNGEYYIESWEPGVEIVLRAHTEGYWREKPYFEKVILKVVTSSATRALLLQSGAVDIAMALGREEYDNLRNAPGIKVLTVPSRTKNTLILNHSMFPFNIKKLRQAVSYLVPYDEIVEGVFKGRAQRMYSLCPQLSPWENGEYWDYEFNVEKAKKLMAEAGYPDGFEFTVNIKAGDTNARKLTIFLKEGFKQAGVDMKIREVTPSIFAEEEGLGTVPATMETGFLQYIDDPYYSMRGFKTGSATNRSHYSNPRIDELYKKLRNTFGEERKKLSDEFQKIVVDDAVDLELACTPLEYAMRDDIKGFKVLEDSLIWIYPCLLYTSPSPRD